MDSLPRLVVSWNRHPPRTVTPTCRGSWDELTIKKEISIRPITIGTRRVQSDDKLIDAWIDLGRLALGRNLPADAVAALERAAALDPKAYVPAYHLAQAYQRIGKDDLAARYRAKAERLRAEQPTVLRGAGGTDPIEPQARSALEQVP